MSANESRNRWDGLRVGDMVSLRSRTGFTRGKVVGLSATDNNRVIVDWYDANGNRKRKVEVAEWLRLEQKVEDIDHA